MSWKIGDVVNEKVVVTEKMVQLFAECSGDYNAVHMDEAYAKTTRFGRRIAHGMLSAGLISRVLAMKLGPGGIYLGQSLKFMNPIFINDEVIIEAKIIKLREEKGIAVCETTVTKTTGEVCVTGEATIMDGAKIPATKA